MELHAPDVPVRDPFMAALRRRHPDVDVVLLPRTACTPQSAREADLVVAGDPVDERAVAAALGQVRRAAAGLWSVLEEPAPPGGRPTVRWVGGPVAGTVLARSRRSVLRPGRDGSLARLGAVLSDAGWRVRGCAGDVELLVGVHDDGSGELGLRATHATGTGALIVALSGAPLPVGAERARALVR